MVFKYKFCIWLVDVLRSQSLTFDEIERKWAISSMNIDGSTLTKRSFDRHRREAEDMLCVDIVCSKREGSRYSVQNIGHFQGDDIQEWMLSAFRMSSIISNINNHRYVVMDKAPQSAHLVNQILEAINQKKGIAFQYKSHYKDNPSDVSLIPGLIRFFKDRWYVIGEIAGKEYYSTFALDRVSDLCILDGKLELNKQIQKELDVETYFDHCYGIIKDGKPEKIRFRAYVPQDDYLREVPLHSSQQEVDRTEYYTEFEIFVRPTFDFKQEILRHQNKLEIISPMSLRNELKELIQSMYQRYQ